MTKFVYDTYHTITVFFIYELLRRKGKNDCKFAISPYNYSINVCCTDFEAILLDNISFQLSKFLMY